MPGPSAMALLKFRFSIPRHLPMQNVIAASEVVPGVGQPVIELQGALPKPLPWPLGISVLPPGPSGNASCLRWCPPSRISGGQMYHPWQSLFSWKKRSANPENASGPPPVFLLRFVSPTFSNHS